MDLKKLPNKITDFIKKNKYVTLILLLGLLLMLLPTKTSKNNTQTKTETSYAQEITIEEQLAAILKQIDGAGKVEVMLTVAKGEEILYQTNEELTTGSDTSKHSIDTVIVTDNDRNQSSLIRQRISPVYLGAIIVCQGADDPTVKLAITEAVSKITGIKSNRISVLKMK